MQWELSKCCFRDCVVATDGVVRPPVLYVCMVFAISMTGTVQRMRCSLPDEKNSHSKEKKARKYFPVIPSMAVQSEGG